MHPQSVEPHPVETPGRDGPVEQEIERERAFRRIPEHIRRHYASPGIDEGRYLALGAPGQTPVRRGGEIAVTVITRTFRGRGQKKQNIHARGIERGGERTERGAGTLDPDRIGIDDEERPRTEMRQSLPYAAS